MREKMSKLYECQPCISSSMTILNSEPRLVDQDALIWGEELGINQDAVILGEELDINQHALIWKNWT